MYYIAAYQFLDVVAAFIFFFQAENIFAKYRKYLLTLPEMQCHCNIL